MKSGLKHSMLSSTPLLRMATMMVNSWLLPAAFLTWYKLLRQQWHCLALCSTQHLSATSTQILLPYHPSLVPAATAMPEIYPIVHPDAVTLVQSLLTYLQWKEMRIAKRMMKFLLHCSQLEKFSQLVRGCIPDGLTRSSNDTRVPTNHGHHPTKILCLVSQGCCFRVSEGGYMLSSFWPISNTCFVNPNPYPSHVLENIKIFCHTILETWGLHCWDVTKTLNKRYIKASSPLDIQSACPPSHKNTIRSILQVTDNNLSYLHSSPSPCHPYTWVQILCGLYKDDIGYMLSVQDNNCDLLIVPYQWPYDKINEDDVDALKEQKMQEWKLFDEKKVVRVGCTLLPFKQSAGIWRCNDGYYHHGLLQHSFSKHSIESITVPFPDCIALHIQVQVDQDLSSLIIPVLTPTYQLPHNLSLMNQCKGILSRSLPDSIRYTGDFWSVCKGNGCGPLSGTRKSP